MNHQLLFLSVTNFFTIFTKLSLREYGACHYLNVRYPNEEMSYIEHDFQQIRDTFYETFQLSGLAPNKYPFQFTSHLGGRIERFLGEQKPHMIFIELQELSEHEFKLMEHVHRFYDGPIAVLVREEDKTTNHIYQLLQLGVKEILSDYDSKTFVNALKRHLRPL